MIELWSLTARRAIELLKAGEVSPLEMVDACADRIDATDGGLNAMPTRCYERARDHAKRLMDKTASDYSGPGALHGLPLAVKELLDLLNEGLAISIGNGTFDRLYKKWITPLENYSTKRSRIVVGGDSNYPPYEYLDENGQPVELPPILGNPDQTIFDEPRFDEPRLESVEDPLDLENDSFDGGRLVVDPDASELD